MSNKALWESVCVTDPRAVKPITGKQYSGNSPKPYWLIERATETFGPVGIGWGVIVKSERFERLSETDVLHVAVVSVWFVQDGKRSETFDQMGGTKACYKTSKGSLMVDEDAGKKSVTDGMVKCLSMIGFAGDIFSGQWDDSKYVESAREHFADKADDTATKTKAAPKGVAAAVLATGAQLSEEIKAWLKDIAKEAMNEFEAYGAQAAYERIEEHNLEAEEKIYLAQQLPTGPRNKIKDYSHSLHNQKVSA